VRTVTKGSASPIHCELERCLSVSTRATFVPWSWSQTARCTASVDFPTPPLVFAKTMFTGSTVARKKGCWQEVFLTCKPAYFPDGNPAGRHTIRRGSLNVLIHAALLSALLAIMHASLQACRSALFQA